MVLKRNERKIEKWLNRMILILNDLTGLPQEYVTGYEKRDHLGFFVKNEFLAWMDSSMCAAYNGSSSKKNIDHKLSYDHFYALWLIDSFSGNRRY